MHASGCEVRDSARKRQCLFLYWSINPQMQLFYIKYIVNAFKISELKSISLCVSCPSSRSQQCVLGISALSQRRRSSARWVSCMRFYWCFLFISGFLPVTVGLETHELCTRHQTLLLLQFFSTRFWVSLCQREPASKTWTPTGPPVERGCLHPALEFRVLYILNFGGWVSTQDGSYSWAPTPIHLERLWGKQSFLLRGLGLPSLDGSPLWVTCPPTPLVATQPVQGLETWSPQSLAPTPRGGGGRQPDPHHPSPGEPAGGITCTLELW